MATTTGIGTWGSTSSGATLDATGITANVGDWLSLAVAADNAGASGVSSTSATITDAAGNTWTDRGQTTESPGSVANDGTVLSLWTCEVTNALVSATITANFSPNTTSKIAALKRTVPAAGERIVFGAVGAGAKGSGTAFDAPTVSVPLGATIIGWVAVEGINAGTADSDTTNGSWSSDLTGGASTGSAGTSQAIGGQDKTVTATGNQSYGRTVGTTRRWAANYIILGYASSGAASGTSTAGAAPVVSGGAAGAATATAAPIVYGTAAGTSTASGFTAATIFASVEIAEYPDRVAATVVPGWPTPLPPPTLQGYSVKPAAAVERRPMEFGAPRVYRRTKRPVIEIAVAWQIEVEKQAVLDYFQATILQQGAQWFGIELALPGGYALAVARFKDKFAMTLRGGTLWQTVATLELLDRPMMTEAELTALLDDDGDPPAWPESLLPPPTLDGWELTPKPAVARSDDLPGLPQARQRSRNSTTEVPASWELDATQAAIFDAFFRYRGRDGAQWFSFPLVQAIGEDDTMVRFIGDADWTPRGGDGRWGVTAPIEIRERRLMTAAEYSAALDA